MDYTIRRLKQEETGILDTFLYEAIFIPEGVEAPPRDIINQPELQVYVDDFGNRVGDMAFVAEANDKVVGAVWVRIMDDYGHVDDDTPSFAISLLKEYRNYGIGTELMKRMLAELKNCGYKSGSLSVQKQNYAVGMYKKVGFQIVDENDEKYVTKIDGIISRHNCQVEKTPFRSKENISAGFVVVPLLMTVVCSIALIINARGYVWNIQSK